MEANCLGSTVLSAPVSRIASAAETVLHEEDLPYAPSDTIRVGPPLP
jgi:hypothetical protein